MYRQIFLQVYRDAVCYTLCRTERKLTFVPAFCTLRLYNVTLVYHDILLIGTSERYQ